MANPLRRFVDKVNQYPQWLSRRLITWAFCSKVKLAGTTGLEILETDGKSVTFRQKNRRKAQNHIKGIHAAAMALLAESATGFVVGLNLPGDKLPLLKSMKVNYTRRSVGDMQAKAWLTDEQIAMLSEQDKGDVLVNVVVTDQSGEKPIEAEMLWAWVPKKR